MSRASERERVGVADDIVRVHEIGVLVENMVLERHSDDVEGPLAPLEPYPAPTALHVARGDHDVATRIARVAVDVDDLARPMDVEAVRP